MNLKVVDPEANSEKTYHPTTPSDIAFGFQDAYREAALPTGMFPRAVEEPHFRHNWSRIASLVQALHSLAAADSISLIPVLKFGVNKENAAKAEVLDYLVEVAYSADVVVDNKIKCASGATFHKLRDQAVEILLSSPLGANKLHEKASGIFEIEARTEKFLPQSIAAINLLFKLDQPESYQLLSELVTRKTALPCEIYSTIAANLQGKYLSSHHAALVDALTQSIATEAQSLQPSTSLLDILHRLDIWHRIGYRSGEMLSFTLDLAQYLDPFTVVKAFSGDLANSNVVHKVTGPVRTQEQTRNDFRLYFTLDAANCAVNNLSPELAQHLQKEALLKSAAMITNNHPMKYIGDQAKKLTDTLAHSTPT